MLVEFWTTQQLLANRSETQWRLTQPKTATVTAQKVFAYITQAAGSC